MGDLQTTPTEIVAPFAISREHLTTFEDFAKIVDTFVTNFQKIWTGVAKGLEQFAIFWRRSELFQQSGWIPHPAAPFDEVSIDLDHEQVADMVEAYYRDHWGQARWTFESRVRPYDIDATAKATFAEALSLHEGGHHRAVVQLLFPEIERVACKEVYLGDQYERRPDGRRNGLITSLKSLREAAGEQLGLSDFGDLRYALSQFQRMSEHLYEKVGDDPVVIAKYAADDVPNRHAALHGLVVYDSAKNSINMIIMADFMFGIIHALKTLYARHAQAQATPAVTAAPVDSAATLLS